MLNKSELIKAWSGLNLGETFYLPVLGPVHVDSAKTKFLLKALIENSEKNNFLSFDKNKRWSEKPTEKILIDNIKLNNKKLFIPSINKAAENIKIYFYANQGPSKDDLKNAQTILSSISCRENSKGVFHWQKQTDLIKESSINNIYLKKISNRDKTNSFDSNLYNIFELDKKLISTLSSFGLEEEHAGIHFYYQNYLLKNDNLGDCFCYVQKNKITGFIGPLNIEKDAYDKPFLLPPFFGVLKNNKKNGIGKKLWQAAMDYAFKRGAQYTLVQNSPNSAAAMFYEKQGLSLAGQNFSINI